MGRGATELGRDEDVPLSERALEAEVSGVVIADVVAPGRPVIYVNAAFERITGLAADDVLGRDGFEFFGEATAEDAVASSPPAERAGGGAALHCYRPAGKARWAEETITAIRDAGGTATHLVAILVDVTERQRTEQALRRSETRFRSAFENAAVGMALVAPDGRFLRVNGALCEILGYSPDELLELTFQAITHPDDLPADVERARQALAGEIDTYQLEKRYVRGDGQVAWALLVASLVRDDENEPAHFVSQVQDITDRKRAESALAQSEERFRGAFDSAPIGMTLTAVDGRFLRVNRAFCDMLGYSASELVATTFQEISHPDELQKNVELLDRATAGEIDSYRLEKRYHHRDGHEVWAVVTASIVRDAAGGAEYMVSQVVDVTERRQAEQALRESEARFRSAFEHAPIGVALGSLDGRFLRVNRALIDMLGCSEEELLGLHFQQITHPDDFHEGLEGLRRLNEGEADSIGLEKRYLHKDGHVVWALLNISVVRDGSGRPQALISNLLDVTERRRMEEELRRTNELLRTVVQAAPLAIVVTDPDDVVTFWNPAAERVYGWSRAEVLGNPYPSRPPERAHEYEEIRATCDRGEWIAGFETQRRRKNGATIDVSVSLAPLRDASGSLVGILGVHEEITERKAAEAALRQSEQHFRAVFDSALDGMAIYDDERRYLEVNDALTRLHGRPREVFAGRRIEDFLIAEGLASLDETWRRLLETGFSSGESEVERDDGERVQIEYTVRANFLPGRHLAVVRDVTERRRLEAQLLQSQRLEAVGRLAGGIAHDFNNLLTAISGYSEFLLGALGGEDPLRRDVHEIQRAADRAAALVRQLLAFSRRQMLRPRVVDLNDVVSEAETLLRRLIGDDIELVTRLDPELPAILADPAQLEQIVVNLAVNARDALPAGGTISISTARVETGRAIRLTVDDTGVGMDANTIAHAFEPFYTTKEPGKGTGLGLATVYGIVTQSGGTIDVRSEPGAGSTFTIVLPAHEGDGPAPPQAE